MKKLLISILSATFLFATGCTRIGPGHVGIKVDMAGNDKGVLNTPVSTGWVFYNPLSTSVIEYSTKTTPVVWTKSKDEGKPEDESITFTNKDSMAINADFGLSYFVLASKVPEFYVKYLVKDLDDFTDGNMRIVVRNCLNDNAGKYDISQIMGDNAQFLKESKDCVNTQLNQYGVYVDQFGLIGAPRPPENVLASINQKIQAEQIALQKQLELQQVTADANKQVAAAEGQAKAQIASANGEAEANRIRTQSITPVILQNKALDNQHDAIWRWDGKMPDTVVSGDGKSSLLFNIPTKGNQ